MRNVTIIGLVSLFSIGCGDSKKEEVKKSNYSASYECIAARYNDTEIGAQVVCQWTVTSKKGKTVKVCQINSGSGNTATAVSVPCETFESIKEIVSSN